ncbi:protein KASH5-like [Maylandia zebra]|uniref:inositol 1,4,5-triphosphate receptor associated 2 n=1 Tax=Haplochromis burtoni TaxID=8153 RepID=UPI0003BD4467|nr:inositol 1,4,5-triphosphate receptor associated 2 [Haplochromis burtoni]
MSDDNNVWETSGCGMNDVFEDSKDTSGLSEHELLDIVYDTCNSSKSGEVLASTIFEYLHTMTAQSPGQDRLAALQRLLDPDCQDPHVSRETFHSTMRTWITQCSEDSTDEDSSHVPRPNTSEEPVNANGLGLSFCQSEETSSEGQLCFCDGKDLSCTVAELKHANRKLSEQNSSLLRTVAQCEDTNLQLTLDITELRAKLVR